MIQKLQMKGRFEIWKRKVGSRCWKLSQIKDNLILTQGLKKILNNMHTAQDTLASLEIGNGITAVALGDTALASILRKATTIDDADVPGDWSESADAIAAAESTTSIHTSSDGTAKSLKLGKDGTASDTITYDNALSGSVNLSSETNHRVNVFNIDTTMLNKLATSGAIKLYLSTAGFGSDFLRWDFDKADLSTSWNDIDMDLSSPDGSSGSTALNNINHLRIEIKVTGSAIVFPSGDVLIDWWNYYDSADNYIKAIDTFPSGGDNPATWETILITLDPKNGSTFLQPFEITELGMKTTNGILLNRIVLNNSETITIEIEFKIKYILTAANA